MALNLRIMLDCYASQGVPITGLRLIGGGAKSAPWRQIMADVTGRDILLTSMPQEATSLGAATAAAVALGRFKDFTEINDVLKITTVHHPEPERASVYDNVYPVFKAAYRQLLPIYDAMAELPR